MLRIAVHADDEQTLEGQQYWLHGKGLPVSLPSAATHCCAATAAAEPPEDPPGTLSGSQGFRVICSQTAKAVVWSW